MSTLALEIRKHYKSKLLVFVLGIAFIEAVWLAGVIMVSASVPRKESKRSRHSPCITI